MDAARDDRPVPTRRALLELEFPGAGDFDDAALEGRRLFSEFFGTFSSSPGRGPPSSGQRQAASVRAPEQRRRG
jgi:hypothetical protein